MIYAVHYAGCEHPRPQASLYEAMKRRIEWENTPEHVRQFSCEPVVLLKIKEKDLPDNFLRWLEANDY